MKHRTVIVGVDGTPSADAAVDWAADEAVRRGLRLELLHTWEDGHQARSTDRGVPGPTVEGADWKVLETAKERVAASHPALDVTMRTSHEDASVALVSCSEDSDLVVVGTHGRSFLGRLLHGSVSRDVAARGHCPVVVVHDGAVDHDLPVVVAVNGSAASGPALVLAASEARERDVSLVVLTAWASTPVVAFDSPPLPPEILDSEQRLAEEVVAAASAAVTALEPGIDVVPIVEHGQPEFAVVAWSERAQLLVIGSRGGENLFGASFGPVASAAVRDASCPVMVVPFQPVGAGES